MFAVIETGGKQYKVSPGQTVEVELLPALPGDTVELGQVLLISTDDQTLIGTPTLEDAKVVARVAQLKRGPKITVFKYKSKSRYRRKTGHRQDYIALTIQDIWANGASLLPAKEEAEAPTDDEAAGIEAAEAAAAEVETAEAEEAPAPPRRRGKKDATSSAAETSEDESAETVTTSETKTRTVKRTRVEMVGEDGEVTQVSESEPEVVSQEVVEEKKSTRRSRKGE